MTAINPGTWVKIIKDGEILHRGDHGHVFSIEKGSQPFLYAVYCADREVWELMEAEQITKQD